MPRPIVFRITAALLASHAIPALAQVRDESRAQLSPGEIEITVHVTCEAMVPAYCQGGYGFAATSSGAWRAGPDPRGRLLAGRLSETERQKLQAAAERVLRGPTGPAHCRPGFAIPGVREGVTVAARGRTIELWGAGGRLVPSCAPDDGASERRKLFALADELMRRYYPRPF
jgi:hypothetical protein